MTAAHLVCERKYLWEKNFQSAVFLHLPLKGAKADDEGNASILLDEKEGDKH